VEHPGSDFGPGERPPLRAEFDDIYDRHKDFVFRYAFYLARDRGEAEDLFQETWLRVARSFDGITAGPERLRPWLSAIVSNLYKDGLRRKRTRRRFLEVQAPSLFASGAGAAPVEAVAPGPGPEKSAENAHLAGRLKEAVAGLPERQRRVFLLKEVEGLSLEEIAGTLGIPLGTVKSLGFRAVQSLRRSLSENEKTMRKSSCDVGIVKAI